MKKILFPAALALVAASSWAFHPNTAEPTSYMLVTSRFAASGVFNARGTITAISPDGQAHTQDVEVKTGTPANVSNSLEQLHIQEIIKLNALRSAGWHVKTATQMNGASYFETTYLLERE